MTIHTNPDARAWAKFFGEKYKVWSEDGVESDSEALMTAWFANAMMAMHDHLVLKGNPINGDHAQYLLDKANGVEERKGWMCPKCGIDRTKDVCPKGDTAVLTGECPMIATAYGVEE